jgi:uncharacterized protein
MFEYGEGNWSPLPPEYKHCSDACQGKGGWKRLLTGLAVAGVALAAGSYALAYLSTHPPRRRLRAPAHDDPFVLEEVQFLSRDGLRLSGWFIPSEGAQAGIILCHGFPNNRSEMLTWARMLHRAGFDLLMFDFRALGQSEGNLCAIGGMEVHDLLGAADYLESRPEMQGLPMGVFGLSMGGAVSIMTAAEDERLQAVATHGAYASLHTAIAQRCRMLAGPLGPALHAPTTWWGRRWFPIHPKNVSPVRAIGKIAPRPVLLFHGEHDVIVRPQDAHALYRAAGGPKELHTLPRSWHVRIDARELPGYEKTLVRFFQRHLAP